MYIKNIEE